MIPQTEQDRQRYEDRRKAQLDYSSGLQAARLEGEHIGVIHFCERLLGRPLTPTAKLSALPLEELSRLVDDLQAQVQSQRAQ